jgi:hypothetical protein
MMTVIRLLSLTQGAAIFGCRDFTGLIVSKGMVHASFAMCSVTHHAAGKWLPVAKYNLAVLALHHVIIPVSVAKLR